MAEFQRESKTFSQVLNFTRPDSGTYYDSAGVLQTAAVDEPRFTNDPDTLESEGLLIEEQRTNLLLWSEDFTQAEWVTSGSFLVSASTEPAPDGGTMYEIDATGGTGQIRQAVSLTQTENVGSCFIKGVAGETIKIEVRASDGSVVAQVEHEFTGDVERIDNSSTSNDWSLQTDNTVFFSIRKDPVNTATVFFAWGAQLEEGFFPTSSIKTEASQVTRSADNCSRALGNEFNASEGTLLWQGRLDFLDSQFLFSHTDTSATANARAPLFIQTDRLRFEVRRPSDGAAYFSLATTAGSMPLGVETKVAISFKDGQQFLYQDGFEQDSATNALPALTWDIFYLGANWTGMANSAGTHGYYKYIPRALSATELEALTS